MDNKEVEGLTQEEWCKYLESLIKALDYENNNESEEYNELS